MTTVSDDDKLMELFDKIKDENELNELKEIDKIIFGLGNQEFYGFLTETHPERYRELLNRIEDNLNNSSLSNEFQMTMVQYKKSITEHINKKA